jgi:hypothetical protein
VERLVAALMPGSAAVFAPGTNFMTVLRTVGFSRRMGSRGCKTSLFGNFCANVGVFPPLGHNTTGKIGTGFLNCQIDSSRRFSWIDLFQGESVRNVWCALVIFVGR